MAGVARGVTHAHAAGIGHRDLKPDNVLVGADGTPRVCDFGLAKLTAAGDGPTATGAVMGTPADMAPEQAAGFAKGVSPAADVWALGAILYRLLTGRPPFSGATAWDTVRQVIEAPVVPPSVLAKGLPAGLEAVCLKCLRKDPGERYPSAEAVADDLGRWLRGEPVTARPDRWRRRAGRTIRWLLIAAVCGLVGVKRYAACRGPRSERAASGCRRPSPSPGRPSSARSWSTGPSNTRGRPAGGSGYEPVGAPRGVVRIREEACAVGLTAGPPTDDQLPATEAVGGPVVRATCRPPATPPLRLGGPLLADMYRGRVARWDDPGLAALNPGRHLPGVPVVAVRPAYSAGRDAYPLAVTYWAVVYERVPGGRGADVAAFLRWAVTDGQKQCGELHYAPLPPDLAARAAAAADRIR